MKIIDILSIYFGGAASYPASQMATGIYGLLPQVFGILALASGRPAKKGGTTLSNLSNLSTSAPTAGPNYE